MTEFDANPYLLNCRNGTVDLRKGRLRPHRREDLITKMLPFDFDQNATCPRFMRFVERIFRVQDAASDIERYKAERLVNYVQRAFGCAATGKPEKFIFFLWGRGNNGKTTLLETIRAVLSEYSGEIQVESLMVRPREAAGSNAINADLADLKGCRFVSSSEVEQNQRLAVARVKYLTGLGQIRARYLRENFFTFQPTHKLFVDCNHRPIISNSHDAVWNRVKVIPFTVEIPTSEIDTNLPNDLQRELPGILNWVVEGARQYLRDGLQDIPEVSSAIQEYREESDTLKDFFREKCDVEPQKLNARGTPEYWVARTTLWKEYQAWTTDTGEKHPASKAGFEDTLHRLGCIQAQDPSGKQRAWRGIRLTASDNPTPSDVNL